MKWNKILLLIAIAMAALLGYCAYVFSVQRDGAHIVGATLGVTLGLTLSGAMALRLESERLQANVALLSSIATFILLVVGAVFCFLPSFRIELFIIVMALISLIYIAIAYSISKQKV